MRDEDPAAGRAEWRRRIDKISKGIPADSGAIPEELFGKLTNADPSKMAKAITEDDIRRAAKVVDDEAMAKLAEDPARRMAIMREAGEWVFEGGDYIVGVDMPTSKLSKKDYGAVAVMKIRDGKTEVIATDVVAPEVLRTPDRYAELAADGIAERIDVGEHKGARDAVRNAFIAILKDGRKGERYETKLESIVHSAAKLCVRMWTGRGAPLGFARAYSVAGDCVRVQTRWYGEECEVEVIRTDLSKEGVRQSNWYARKMFRALIDPDLESYARDELRRSLAKLGLGVPEALTVGQVIRESSTASESTP